MTRWRTALVVAALASSPATAGASVILNGPEGPRVAYLTVHEGEAGGELSIVGTGLAGATSVLFGSTPGSFRVETPERIRATVPPGSGSVDVQVASAVGTSPSGLGDEFSYLAPPAPQESAAAEPSPIEAGATPAPGGASAPSPPGAGATPPRGSPAGRAPDGGRASGRRSHRTGSRSRCERRRRARGAPASRRCRG